MQNIEDYINKIICGDSLTVMKSMPSESVDLVVTSPPYYKQREYCGIGIGNEQTENEYLDNIISVFNECVRGYQKDRSYCF
jgi:site-specific DNA-methyltransferase (adenine-specific)